MQKKLSIVTLTYNHEKFIEQALQSFLMQRTTFPFEILISDDCSTDNTAEIIRKYHRKHPDIIKPIFREQNIGVTENYIETLSLANTEYLIYCEGDDYFNDPLKLEKQVNFLETNQEFSICFHPVNVIYEGINRAPEIFPTPDNQYNKNIFKFSELIYHNFMQTNSVMYRWMFGHDRQIKDFFPKNIMPCDWFLHLLHASEGKIGFIDEVMATYRRHPGGIFWQDIFDVNQVYLKHGVKQLNFRVQAAKMFLNNDPNYRSRTVFPLAFCILMLFLKNGKTDKIQNFIDICPEEYEYVIKKLHSFLKLPV